MTQFNLHESQVKKCIVSVQYRDGQISGSGDEERIMYVYIYDTAQRLTTVKINWYEPSKKTALYD